MDYSTNNNGEHSPLLRHMSIDEENAKRRFHKLPGAKLLIGFLLCLILVGCFASLDITTARPTEHSTTELNIVVPIENATEHFIQVDAAGGRGGIFLWYRIWGNKETGIPLLFVHGGPGQAVADYKDGNKRFFDASEFFVVEVDQRGTGKSKPSVRDDLHNMDLYDNISVDLISKDFEVIRKHLGIEQWMVWGGSFGSTIALDYGLQFPERCLALILRGIYLDTVPEVSSVYSRDAYRHNRKRLREFQMLFEVADDYKRRIDGSGLDPNDALGLMQIYETMIQEGRKDATWHWYAFENNLMEEKPENLLDPFKIDESRMPEAQSVAFFELRLWLHASLEQPTNILERVGQLSDTPVWICQGLRDEVCPSENARALVKELHFVGAPLKAYFVNSGHEDTDPVMEKCLQRSIHEFRDTVNLS